MLVAPPGDQYLQTMDESSYNIVAKFSTCKSENENMNETLPEAQRTQGIEFIS